MEFTNFPVIISSSLPSPNKVVIVKARTEDKEEIINQLQEQCTIGGIATELAIQASVAGGSSRTFLHDELLYKILLRFLRVG